MKTLKHLSLAFLLIMCSLPALAADFTLSDNGSTPELVAHDGRFVLQLDGDFGGGTFDVEVEVNPDEWQTIEGAEFSSGPISREILVPHGSTVRGTLSGATAPDLTGLMGI